MIQQSVCAVVDPCYFFTMPGPARNCLTLKVEDGTKFLLLRKVKDGFYVLNHRESWGFLFSFSENYFGRILPCFFFYALLIYQVQKTFIYAD
jgi:hypothetical protein